MTTQRISRRRFTTFAALAAGGATGLAACSSGSKDSTSGSGKGDGLTFLNQSRGQEAVLTKLAEQYSAANGVKVTVDSPGPADYAAKLQSRVQSGDMPDIYSAIGLDTMAPYYKAGWAMDLTSALDGEWGGSLSPLEIQLSTYAEGNPSGVPAGIYSVHWDLLSYGLFFDPAATGLDAANVPATIPDLTAALRSAGAAGRFSVAASTTPFLLQSYASNFMTDDEIAATLNGRATWKSDAWEATFQLLVDLQAAGVVLNDSLPGGTDDNPNVEKSFFNSHTAGMIFDSTAAVAVARNTAADYTSYASMGVPAAADGTEEARSVVALGKGAVINPKSERAEEALKFVQWLTAAEQQKVFATEVGVIPTNSAVLAAGDLLPQMAGFIPSLDSAQTSRAAFTADVVSAIGAGAQSLVLGETTVADVLSSVQDAQDVSAS